VYFCGVFDGHGPSGHKVARRARDQLPMKLSAAQKLLHTNGRSQSDVDAFYEYEDDEEAESSDYVDASEDFDAYSVFYSWKTNFMRSFKDVDKELSLDASIDSYCSGTTAVTIVKQVFLYYACSHHVSVVVFKDLSSIHIILNLANELFRFTINSVNFIYFD